MSRREQITMTAAEVDGFLDGQRTVICATNGADGWPHLMPLWFVVREGTLWAWTYAASQKVRNLERDSRASLQLEDGVEYSELRGVLLRVQTTVHREIETVAATGRAIFQRYAAAAGDLAPEVEAMVAAQAAKRVALEFREIGRATWDHRKLAGVY